MKSRYRRSLRLAALLALGACTTGTDAARETVRSPTATMGAPDQSPTPKAQGTADPPETSRSACRRRTLDGIEGSASSECFAILRGEVTFRAPGAWEDHAEAYLDPRLFFLVGPEGSGEYGGEIQVIGIAVANGAVRPPPELPCDRGSPTSAEAIVRAIRSDPDLDATVPVIERVGGIKALRLEVAPVRGASTCPPSSANVPVASGVAWGSVEHGDRARLYVLDLPGGSARTLVIMTTAPEEAFERVVEEAAPVVESFRFHTR